MKRISLAQTAGLALAWLAAVGCAALPRPAQVACLSPGLKPDNVFLYAPTLSPDIKRVAVLPLACEDQRPDLHDGCAALQSIVPLEIEKTRKFEVVNVDPECLRNRTGNSAWTGCEVLPRDFFDLVRESSGCDAVLFSQLTAFRAYAPLAVGFRMRLVNARTGQTLWAVDELMDAGQCVESNGTSLLDELCPGIPSVSREEWTLLNSPRKLGQYAAAQVLATLPRR